MGPGNSFSAVTLFVMYVSQSRSVAALARLSSVKSDFACSKKVTVGWSAFGFFFESEFSFSTPEKCWLRSTKSLKKMQMMYRNLFSDASVQRNFLVALVHCGALVLFAWKHVSLCICRNDMVPSSTWLFAKLLARSENGKHQLRAVGIIDGFSYINTSRTVYGEGVPEIGFDGSAGPSRTMYIV